MAQTETEIYQDLVVMKINISTKIIVAFALCLGINLSINNIASARPKHSLLEAVV